VTDAATITMFTPPGHFMCCICFETFPLIEAWKDSQGQAWDMCKADGWESDSASSVPASTTGKNQP